MTDSEQIEKAQRLVALVLAQLERETGGYVRDIAVTDLDITTISDDTQQLKRRVMINVKPKPGTN